MRNILTVDNGIAILLANDDDRTNAVVINGVEIPSTDWTGTGNYTFTDGGVTFTIQRIADDSGNIMLQLVSGTTYKLVKMRADDLSKAYMIDDPTESTIDDGDYFPFYDTSAAQKKKTLWSTIVDKIKSVLGIAASGTTFLRKDGAWATPTNTTYTFATGDNNGQIKVTPSGGTAQNISVKGLGSAAYETADATATANTVVKRNSSGYIYGAYFNATNAEQNPASYTSSAVFQDSNGWFRKSSKTNFQTWLGCALSSQLTDGSVTKVGTSTVGGNANTPIRLVSGTPKACNSFVPVGGGTFTGDVSVVGGTLSVGDSSHNGKIWFYNSGSHGSILPTTLTANRTLYMPDESGTIFTSAGGVVAGNITVNRQDGTTTSDGLSHVILGNATASGTAKNSAGNLRLYSLSTSYINLRAQNVTSSRTLYLPSSGTALATSSSSSYRVKENIRDMTEEEARKILDVDVIKFDYREEYEKDLLDQSGVIAEEVMDIIPEVVSVHPLYDETKAIDPASNPSSTVDYAKFAPYLIKMIQIQQKKIEELEERLADLEN